MKQCPTCNRTYADETLTFCLSDGSLLSASYDPQATQQLPAPRVTDPPPTMILPPTISASPQEIQKKAAPRFRYIGLMILAVLVVGALIVFFKYGMKNLPNESEAIITQAQASSILPLQGSNQYSPRNAIDGNLSTAWAEGVQGSGIGEWISFSFGARQVQWVEIYPGYFKSPQHFSKNNRLKRATILFSDGTKINATFADEMTPQTFKLGAPIFTNSIKLIIEEIYQGSQYDDTLISEVKWGM